MTISPDLSSLESDAARYGGFAGSSWLEPKAHRLVGAAIGPMVLVTMWLALTSDHLQRPLAAGLYWSYLTAVSMAIGLYWWHRRPASRFGPLLVVFGVLSWLVSWQGASAPLVFSVGVLAEAPFFVLTFYLFLAFPMGRLDPPAAAWLMAALVLGVLAFFVPWALFSPVIAGGGPLTACVPDCPQNALQIASAPTVVEVAGKAETYVALALTIATLAVYAMRIARASRPQRRALTAVAVTSLLFLPAYFIFNFSAWVLKLDPATLSTLAWGIVATRVLLPLGFLIALLQADRFAAAALRTMLERLAARPTPREWRDTIATALDDRALRLGYRDPETRRFHEPDGDELSRPGAGTGRVWLPIDRVDEPVAAMVIDETLAEDPELVRAAATATLLAVENGALEGELRASRAQVLEISRVERQRIQRDIHDSAQQRLLALRIHLTLASEQLEHSEDRAVLQRLDDEVELAIQDLRGVAHDSVPPILRHGGLRPALAAVAAGSPIPVRVVVEGPARRPEALEAAIYFCCLEGLQNVAKHAGPGASTTIQLTQRDGHVRFRIADDGVGFDPASVVRGAGLTNLEDRVESLGGTLRIESAPGCGTRITGEVPMPAALTRRG
jgi:signal transduction histidine kinase